MNAEYSRKGSKIPDETRRDWLDTEKEYEDKVEYLNHSDKSKKNRKL